ncbi:MAG TPA: DUF6457 domain-containing protein [Acidimicrobiales bacterium]|nr:DUF6457 domain-containing protein [Acidimicrobiales bacterium]
MDDWLDRYAAALGLSPLDGTEVDAILDLARVVAHGTERKNAPLAAWLAGRSTSDAAAALALAHTLLPPQDGGGPAA